MLIYIIFSLIAGLNAVLYVNNVKKDAGYEKLGHIFVFSFLFWPLLLALIIFNFIMTLLSKQKRISIIQYDRIVFTNIGKASLWTLEKIKDAIEFTKNSIVPKICNAWNSIKSMFIKRFSKTP